jgi:integrase
MADKKRRKRAGARYWVEKNGCLYVRLQYTDEYGRKREKHRKISKKSEARDVIEQMRYEVRNYGSDTLQADRITFDELADQYEEIRITPAVFINGIKVAGKKSCSTVKSSIKMLRKHFGRKPIRLIKASDIEAFRKARIGAPVVKHVNEIVIAYNPKTKRHRKVKKKVPVYSQRSIATVNRELQTLKAMLNFAIQNDWLIQNPFAKYKGIISAASEVKRDRVLSYEEEEHLLAACVDRRAHLRPIVICALDTGMRRGEMFQMRWRDVDLRNRQIHIPQTNTKTQTARTVGVTERLKSELELLWDASTKRPDGLVFGVTTDVKNAWKSALREAGIENFRLHDCRHTATTRMIASGSHHTEVMKITGHSQMITFLRYLNVTAETTKRVSNRLDEYLSNRVPIQEIEVGDYLN